MKHDPAILVAVAIALLPLLALLVLKAVSLSRDVRGTRRWLISFRGLNWLGLGILVLAGTLSDTHSSLWPLVAACYLGDFGWSLAARWLRHAYPWPKVEGHITSISPGDGSELEIGYSFDLGSGTYGGLKITKAKGIAYVVGQRVEIAYDPLDPDESTLVPEGRV